MQTYRVGLIGLGVMGQEMAAQLAAHPRFRVAAGFDPARPSVPFPLMDSALAVIRNPEIDAIYIATPPKTHEAIMRLVVAAGKPVLCEKPLAHSVTSARHCRDLAAEARIQSAVNFHFATRDAAVRMGRVIASGDLGEIQSIKLRARFAQWPRSWQAAAGNWLAEPQEGGFTREVVSHYIFLANRLFGRGRLRNADIIRGSKGIETSLKAEIAHGPITFTIDAAIGGDRDDDIRFAVTGSKGEIAIVDWRQLDYAGDAGPALPDSAPLDALADMLDGNPTELATLDEGYQVVELIEQMLDRR